MHLSDFDCQVVSFLFGAYKPLYIQNWRPTNPQTEFGGSSGEAEFTGADTNSRK